MMNLRERITVLKNKWKGVALEPGTRVPDTRTSSEIYDGVSDISLEDSVSIHPMQGFPSMTRHTMVEHPLVEPGSIVFGWGFPDFYTKMLERVQYAAQRDDSAVKNSNARIYELLITQLLRGKYVTEKVKKVIQDTQYSPKVVHKVLEALVKQGVADADQLPPENEDQKRTYWKEHAQKSQVIIVGRKVIANRTTWHRRIVNVTEPCFQIIDPLSGQGTFDDYKTLSEVIQENTIEATAGEHERTAAVLKALANQEPQKATIILYEDKKQGNDAIRVSQALGVPSYPLIERKMLEEAKGEFEKRSRDSMSKLAIASVTASAIMLGGGLYAIKRYHNPGAVQIPAVQGQTQENNPLNKIFKKHKKPKTIPSLAIGKVSYDRGEKKLFVDVTSSDKDKIRSIEGTLVETSEKLFRRTYKDAKVTEHYTIEYKLKPGKYHVKIAVTDGEGATASAEKEFEVEKIFGLF